VDENLATLKEETQKEKAEDNLRQGVERKNTKEVATAALKRFFIILHRTQ